MTLSIGVGTRWPVVFIVAREQDRVADFHFRPWVFFPAWSAPVAIWDGNVRVDLYGGLQHLNHASTREGRTVPIMSAMSP